MSSQSDDGSDRLLRADDDEDDEFDVAPTFGMKDGQEVVNKDTVLSEIDEALGQSGPPDLELIFTEPWTLLAIAKSRHLSSSSNPYGHISIRFRVPYVHEFLDLYDDVDDTTDRPNACGCSYCSTQSSSTQSSPSSNQSSSSSSSSSNSSSSSSSNQSSSSSSSSSSNQSTSSSSSSSSNQSTSSSSSSSSNQSTSSSSSTSNQSIEVEMNRIEDRPAADTSVFLEDGFDVDGEEWVLFAEQQAGHSARRRVRGEADRSSHKPRSTTTLVMNIVGYGENVSMVNFVDPATFFYGTNEWDRGNEQGGCYNRTFHSLRIERIDIQKLARLYRFYVDLNVRNEQNEAHYSLMLSYFNNWLWGAAGTPRYGNCSFWVSRGLVEAGIVPEQAASMWPKALFVHTYRIYAGTQQQNLVENTHVVSYSRIAGANSYGVDVDPPSWVKPLYWRSSRLFAQIARFADVIVSVQPGSRRAVVRRLPDALQRRIRSLDDVAPLPWRMDASTHRLGASLASEKLHLTVFSEVAHQPVPLPHDPDGRSIRAVRAALADRYDHAVTWILDDQAVLHVHDSRTNAWRSLLCRACPDPQLPLVAVQLHVSRRQLRTRCRSARRSRQHHQPLLIESLALPDSPTRRKSLPRSFQIPVLSDSANQSTIQATNSTIQSDSTIQTDSIIQSTIQSDSTIQSTNSKIQSTDSLNQTISDSALDQFTSGTVLTTEDVSFSEAASSSREPSPSSLPFFEVSRPSPARTDALSSSEESPSRARVAIRLREITAGRDGSLWGLTDDGRVVFHSSQHTATARRQDNDDDDDDDDNSNDDDVQPWYYLPLPGGDESSGTFVGIAALSTAELWAFDAGHRLYHWSLSNGWQLVQGLLVVSVTVLHDSGDVLCIALTGELFRRAGDDERQWTLVPMPGHCLAALSGGSAHNLWGVSSEGALWLWDDDMRRFEELHNRTVRFSCVAAASQSGRSVGICSLTQTVFSLSRSRLRIRQAGAYRLLYRDESAKPFPFSIWRAEPLRRAGRRWYPLGDVCERALTPDPSGFSLLVAELLDGRDEFTSPLIAPPVDYRLLVVHKSASGDVCRFWRPLPPKQFACCGDLVTVNDKHKPAPDAVACLHWSLCERPKFFPDPVYRCPAFALWMNVGQNPQTATPNTFIVTLASEQINPAQFATPRHQSL